VSSILPSAEPDRRCSAFVLDRLLAWGLVVLVAVPAGLLAAAATLLLVGLAGAVLRGLSGASPGTAAFGLRTVDAGTGAPVGVGRAVLRGLVLGLATLPTAGLGAAVLAWTALTDPGGRRRGWHDLRAGTVVVDVRRPAAPAPVEAEPPGLVNLTALRLAPPGPVVGPPQRPTRTLPGRWRVAFDSGETFPVTGPVLVGRAPAGEATHVVALPDPSVSKTHAELRPTPDGALVVMDRGSTNGSALVRGGLARPLTAHRPATLLPGDVVRFGDRSMTVAEDTPLGSG